MQQAFVLGAGLGERLRPLTAQLPKPLIPVFHEPLITYAFDHLISAGVKKLVVNTHHLAERYVETFPGSMHGEVPIAFRRELPTRLETAGGIANVRDLLGEEAFVVYNGDILTTLPLEPLLRGHRERKNLVTLVLRSQGPAQHIAYDPSTGLVTDIRGQLGTGNQGTHLFTGIYLCEPGFHDWLTPGKVESVVPIFLRLIQSGERLGAVVVDEGIWWDLGSRAAYLQAHQALAQEEKYASKAVHPSAEVSPQARLHGLNIIGPEAKVGEGAVLEDCILWPRAEVAAHARLKGCIVRSGICAEGTHEAVDL